VQRLRAGASVAEVDTDGVAVAGRRPG
jgi:hypothetical protein